MVTTTGSALGNLGEYHGRPLPSVPGIFSLKPNGYCGGLMVRNSNSKEFFAPNIGAFVHEIKWNEWQPTSAPDLDDAKVAQAQDILDWAYNNGKRVRLRVFAGIYAPSWVNTAVGGMDWYDYNATAGETYKGVVPVWWDGGLAEVYSDFCNLLIQALGGHLGLYEVTNSMCMTIFAEPMNRQWGSDHNVAMAHSKGYTVAADLAAMSSAYQIHQQWAQAGVATYSAFNPWQEPRNLDTDQTGGVKVNPTVTYTQFESFRQLLGRCAVYANNSIGAPITSRGPRYADLWSYMGAAASNPYPFYQPVSFQTMNSRVMTTFNTTAYATADMIETFGGLSVEMPDGWLGDPVIGMTTDQAAALNARFAQNLNIVESS